MFQDRPLQLAILGALWREADLSHLSIWRAVCRTHHDVAVSTVSTTLTRLVERGWVMRPAKGRYRAGISRAALIDELTKAIEEA